MATVHPHLLFAKELSMLADIHHPDITESNPKNKGGAGRAEGGREGAQQSMKRGGSNRTREEGEERMNGK